MPDIIINYVIFCHEPNIDELALFREYGNELELLISIEEGEWKPGILIKSEPVAQRPLPPLEGLPYFSRGFSQEVADDFVQCRTAISILGLGPFDSKHRLLRHMTKSVASIANQLDGYVFDAADSLTFTVEAFEAIRLAEIANGELSTAQFGVRAYRTDEALRSVSMGLEKFGQPNFCVANFAEHHMGKIDPLAVLAMQHMIESPTKVVPGVMTLDISQIKNSTQRSRLQDHVKKGGGKGTVQLSLEFIEPHDGDPQTLIGPVFNSRVAGDTLWAEQEQILEQLFGQARDISQDVQADSIEQAIERARVEAMTILNDPSQWHIPGRRFRMAVSMHDTREVVWVEVQTWNGNVGTGLLLSEPIHTQGLNSGSVFEFDQSMIMDYQLMEPAGIIAAGGIDELIRQMR